MADILAERDCLTALKTIYQESGKEGMLPQNLPDYLIEIMAERGHVEESVRRNLVAAALSLMLHGDTDVEEHAQDPSFATAFVPYVLNILLEGLERNHWTPGVIRATLDNVLQSNRIAIVWQGRELTLAEAIAEPPESPPLNKYRNLRDENEPQRARVSVASISCVIAEDKLAAFKDLDAIFMAMARRQLFFLNDNDVMDVVNCRLIEPVNEGVKGWRYQWASCQIYSDRRTAVRLVREWAENYASDVIDLKFTVQELSDPMTFTTEDLKKSRKVRIASETARLANT